MPQPLPMRAVRVSAAQPPHRKRAEVEWRWRTERERGGAVTERGCHLEGVPATATHEDHPRPRGGGGQAGRRDQVEHIVVVGRTRVQATLAEERHLVRGSGALAAQGCSP